jgi:DNA anti-recombination protein RmuC
VFVVQINCNNYKREAPMPQVKFNADLSLGNIITILTLIIGFSAGWQSLNSDVQASKSAVTSLAQRVATVESKMEASSNASNDEKVKLAAALTQLQTDVQYLRVAVDELKKMRGAK